jgi:hypothetical protein
MLIKQLTDTIMKIDSKIKNSNLALLLFCFVIIICALLVYLLVCSNNIEYIYNQF